MKIPGIVEQKQYAVMRVLMAALLFFVVWSGIAFAAGGEHEAAPKGWVMTDTWRVMNFAVLAIGLFLLLRKPAAKALDARIKGIQSQLAELEEKKKSAEKELAEYNEKLKLLDIEADKIVAEYIRQGNEAKSRILKEAENAAQRLEEQAKRNVEHEFGQAKLKLQHEIIGKALVKAEEIVKSQITIDDQNRLVDEYLEKVVVK